MSRNSIAVRRTFCKNDNIMTNEDKDQLIAKVKTLERDLDRRQESYITRETIFKSKIEELENEILRYRNEKTAWMDDRSKPDSSPASSSDVNVSNKPRNKLQEFKLMQDQIIKNVETVQQKAMRVIKEQEQDLSKQFQAKLFDLQAELEREKSKGDDGSLAWIQKSKRLQAELEVC